MSQITIVRVSQVLYSCNNGISGFFDKLYISKGWSPKPGGAHYLSQNLLCSLSKYQHITREYNGSIKTQLNRSLGVFDQKFELLGKQKYGFG